MADKNEKREESSETNVTVLSGAFVACHGDELRRQVGQLPVEAALRTRELTAA